MLVVVVRVMARIRRILLADAGKFHVPFFRSMDIRFCLGAKKK